MADFRTLPNNQNPNPYADRFEKHQTWVKWLWRIFKVGLVVLGVSIILFSFLTPSFKKLEDPSLNLASEVICNNDSTVLGRLYIHNRTPVRFEDIPKHMVKTLISTEDLRFYDHSGIDYEALARVIFKTFLMAQSDQGGGSTISMQLAKLLYSDRDLKDKNFIEKAFGYYYRKLSEMITAVKLERAYTKEEIIAMYLNTYDFGYNAHGIRAASEVYFSKAPEQLTIDEGATLVGMLKNSSLYNPIRRNERTKQRRNNVLVRAEENGVINKRQLAELIAKPLDISKFKTRSHNDGLATYFRTTLADEVKQILKNAKVTKADGTPYDVYRDGLKIYTTIDPEQQRLAEESMREHMAVLQAKYFKVWRGRDPWNYRDSETTDAQIALRQASLDAQIRNSERYAMMRSKYLDEVLGLLEEDFENVQLVDWDILNMLKQEKTPAHFEQLLKTNSINPKKLDMYRQIMANSNWAKLKGQWTKLQNDTRVEFNKATKMKVFAYNAFAEKDTTMTPLDSIRYHRMHLQLGSMGIDPSNGHVKFWVGGVGHKYFQVDHVKVDRQVGSTFKPFIYITAISRYGISPCTMVQDAPQTIGAGEGSFGLMQPWTPKNAGGYSYQTSTLLDALKESRNTASVYLMKQITSTQPVREIVQEMGINVDAKYPNGQLRIPKTPAICLGAADLTVNEMTGAYATFANGGVYNKPTFIRKITDKAGRVIYNEFEETGKKRVALAANYAYVMLQMLKHNVHSAPGIKTLKSEVGGKTGTTNDYRDGWFMGVTPNLVVGTWVGGEDQWIRFLRIEDGQGGAMARPFFAKFMAKVEKSTTLQYNTDARFKKPEGGLGVTMDCADYLNDAPVFNTEGGGLLNNFQDEEQSTTPAAAPATGPATPTTPAAGVIPPKQPAPKPIVPKPTAPKPISNTKSVPEPKTRPDDGFNG
jgi:penicillin-binding protein 1A